MITRSIICCSDKLVNMSIDSQMQGTSSAGRVPVTSVSFTYKMLCNKSCILAQHMLQGVINLLKLKPEKTLS